MISPSDIATSGIAAAPAGTETETDSAAGTGKGRNPFLNSGGPGGTSSGKVIGGTVAGVVAIIVIVIAVIWLLGKVGPLPRSLRSSELADRLSNTAAEKKVRPAHGRAATPLRQCILFAGSADRCEDLLPIWRC